MFFDFSILKWSQRKFEKIESSNIYVVEILYDNKEHFPNLLSHIIDLCTLGTLKSNFFLTKNRAKIATFFTPSGDPNYWVSCYKINKDPCTNA